MNKTYCYELNLLRNTNILLAEKNLTIEYENYTIIDPIEQKNWGDLGCDT